MKWSSEFMNDLDHVLALDTEKFISEINVCVEEQ